MARKELKLVGVNCELDLHAALERFALDNGITLSEAARLLLREALASEGAKLVSAALESRGYRAGFRRGLADVYQHMARLKPQP